jgi:hypothetical protein
MNNWTVIIAFTYGHEAHLVKSILESEEIEVILRDELNAQVCEAGANAVGGVKVCVRQQDVVRAMHLLKKGGFINEHSETESGFMKKLGRYTSKVPLIGKLAPELVLILLIAILVTLLYIPLAIMNIP